MKEIIYSTYYWQDEEIRLRAIEPEDWEGFYYNRFDTPTRRLLECAVELPPTMTEAKSFAEKYKITLQEWNHDQDHVHVLMKAHPNTEISKFLNAYKSASSRLIKKEFPIIRTSLWKEYFWSRSYCLLTTVGAPIDVNQEVH